MLENNQNNNSEINLNLKVPPEQQDGSFSMKDLVLTLYNARKIFLICCCIGLIAGIVGAGAYYYRGRSNTPVSASDEASVILTLNYKGAEHSLSPNGTAFDIKSFYAPELWENALKTAGKDDITAADAMKELRIAQYNPLAEQPEGGTPDTMLPSNTMFSLTVSANSSIFKTTAEKEEFLQIFCGEYKNFIADKYFTENNVGLLYGQRMRELDDICTEIIWDSFNYEENFNRLSYRYSQLVYISDLMYSEEPSYETADGKTFSIYSKEFRDIINNEIEQWKAKLKEKIYIRNIDRFKEEYQLQIESMKMEREYYAEITGTYNDLLSSFQQKDAQGVRIQESVNVLTSVQSYGETAASLQKQISQMNHNFNMLQINEPEIRSSSSEAETALNGFITVLEKNQDMLRSVLYDYYSQINERNAESSVIYTSAEIKAVAQPSSVSIMRLVMIFAGLTFVGFAVGFCAAFVKKYIPVPVKA